MVYSLLWVMQDLYHQPQEPKRVDRDTRFDSLMNIVQGPFFDRNHSRLNNKDTDMKQDIGMDVDIGTHLLRHDH